jgi:hypothetical protein
MESILHAVYALGTDHDGSQMTVEIRVLSSSVDHSEESSIWGLIRILPVVHPMLDISIFKRRRQRNVAIVFIDQHWEVASE